MVWNVSWFGTFLKNVPNHEMFQTNIIQSCSIYMQFFGWRGFSNPAYNWKIFGLGWMTVQNQLIFDFWWPRGFLCIKGWCNCFENIAQMFFLEQSDLLFEFLSCKVLENVEQEKNRSSFDREKKICRDDNERSESIYNLRPLSKEIQIRASGENVFCMEKASKIAGWS